jgi:outer membrane protein TolC
MAARSPVSLAYLLASVAVVGCVGVPAQEEKVARADLRAAGEKLRPPDGRSLLPELRADSPPEEFVRYAVFNNPAVAAAYFDWRASVEDIVQARSAPDPQFVFQADITNTLSSFMPGLMFDFMGSGKREAMGREAAMASGVARRAYISAVYNTAAEARKAWIELAYVEDAARIREMSATALGGSLAVADIDYSTGRGMGTLADHVRIENELAKAQSELESLGDRRLSARLRFKSAMGLGPSDPDPVWPKAKLSPTAIPSPDELWRRAIAASPDLGRMRTMVEMAISGVEVARRARQPDFTLGAMVDLRTNPTLFRPLATLDLPIWRDKVAAVVAAAEARRDASLARVSAEQLNLAAELAQALYMVKEADRMIAFIDRDALPSYERAISTAEAASQSGVTNAAMIPEAEFMALSMRLERLGALRDRETAVTDLMLLTADIVPSDSPLPETPPHS